MLLVDENICIPDNLGVVFQGYGSQEDIFSMQLRWMGDVHVWWACGCRAISMANVHNMIKTRMHPWKQRN